MAFSVARQRASFIGKMIRTSHPSSNPVSAALYMRSRPGFQRRQGRIIMSFRDNIHARFNEDCFKGIASRYLVGHQTGADSKQISEQDRVRLPGQGPSRLAGPAQTQLVNHCQPLQAFKNSLDAACKSRSESAGPNHAQPSSSAGLSMIAALLG
eukprot:352791-Chlamydomonas_euryale.AAC.13